MLSTKLDTLQKLCNNLKVDFGVGREAGISECSAEARAAFVVFLKTTMPQTCKENQN